MKTETHFVSRKELARLAKRALGQVVLCRVPGRATIMSLTGNLGAGKTTFVHALGQLLKIRERILSPTFVFVHEHTIEDSTFPFRKLIHVDAYRIDNRETLDAIRLAEYLKHPENLVVIEWGEKIAKWLPSPQLTIEFAHYKPTIRRVQLKSKIKYQNEK